MFPDHGGYDAETDLDKIKARRRLDWIRGKRRESVLAILVMFSLALLFFLYLQHKRSVIMRYPAPPANSAAPG